VVFDDEIRHLRMVRFRENPYWSGSCYLLAPPSARLRSGKTPGWC
jgi:hypothetical protein